MRRWCGTRGRNGSDSMRTLRWPGPSRSVGTSWIESLREKADTLSLETVRSWLSARGSEKDEIDALMDGLREYGGRRGLDRILKFKARQRNPELLWLKLGVVCAERLE